MPERKSYFMPLVTTIMAIWIIMTCVVGPLLIGTSLDVVGSYIVAIGLGVPAAILLIVCFLS